MIIIDALDESGDGSARRSLLKVLAENASKTPPNFRILIASCHEEDIIKTLLGKLPDLQQKAMDAMGPDMDPDIRKFTKQELLDVFLSILELGAYSEGQTGRHMCQSVSRLVRVGNNSMPRHPKWAS